MRAVLPAVAKQGWHRIARQPEAEAFALRAVLHGQLWLTIEAEPLPSSLEERALRVLISRALADELTEAERSREPALDYPLALVEAVCRSLPATQDVSGRSGGRWPIATERRT